MQKFVKQGVLLTFGSALIALGIYFFKFPNNFATGVVSGLPVILGRIVRGISPGTFIPFINMALMVIGFFIVGRGVTGRSVYCSVVNSLTVLTLERVYPMSAPFTSQPLMELIFEILLTAVGSAILIQSGRVHRWNRYNRHDNKEVLQP